MPTYAIHMSSVFVCLAVVAMFHWLGDFVFQSSEIFKGKYKSYKKLLLHTGIYTLVMLVGFSITNYLLFSSFFNDWALVLLALCMAVVAGTCHNIIETITNNESVAGSCNAQYALIVIGFEQLMHAVALLTITYTTWHQLGM